MRKAIANVLKDQELENTLPIPIEELLDVKLGVSIIPFPYLSKTHEINAFTSNDFQAIFVDEYLYNHLEKPYRFTLAHEFGHMILHKEIYYKHKPKSVSDWKGFIQNVAESDRQILEYQADDFAGLFLVPENQLQKHFGIQVRKNKNFLIKEFKALPKHQFTRIVAKYIANELTPIFNVHHSVTEIRIKKSHLERQIVSLYPSI